MTDAASQASKTMIYARLMLPPLESQSTPDTEQDTFQGVQIVGNCTPKMGGSLASIPENPEVYRRTAVSSSKDGTLAGNDWKTQTQEQKDAHLETVRSIADSTAATMKASSDISSWSYDPEEGTAPWFQFVNRWMTEYKHQIAKAGLTDSVLVRFLSQDDAESLLVKQKLPRDKWSKTWVKYPDLLTREEIDKVQSNHGKP